jgi:RES domain-containing protein
MRQAWRIVKASQAATAFDGEGARLFGGRWNSPGTRVVYASATLSLAALELLVHLPSAVRLRYVAIKIEFPDALVEVWKTNPLPSNWHEEPPPPSAQALGDRWVKEARSVVIELPSVIIPTERNYVLNPAHSAFKKVKIGRPMPFSFDPRLL